MDADALTARLGESQGLVIGPDGVARFVLGDLTPGWFEDLSVGDFVQVSQSLDLTGVDLVRALVRLHAPKSLAAAFAWEVSVTVDGAKRARMTCASGRERTITDLAANVSKVSGVHVVGLRLELVAA